MQTTALPVDRINALSRSAALVAAVDGLYAMLDARVAARSPTCINRALCCKFEQFDHRLFVTPVELAYFLAKTDFPPRIPITAAACPYHIDGLCTARDARPTGCRVFFCEAADQSWQSGETEHALEQLKALHREFDLPYAYVEWTTALKSLAAAPSEPGESLTPRL